MLLSVVSVIEKEDDRDFIMVLYKKYHRLVYKKVIEKIGVNRDSEDLVNDTFIKLIEKIELLKGLGERELLFYIVETANHLSIDYIRRCSVQRKHIYYGNGGDAYDDIADLVEEQYSYNERIEDLAETILLLPERDYGLLVSKYYFNKTDSEIAAEIGIRENSVRQYLTRARRRARALMEKGLEDDEIG